MYFCLQLENIKELSNFLFKNKLQISSFVQFKNKFRAILGLKSRSGDFSSTVGQLQKISTSES